MKQNVRQIVTMNKICQMLLIHQLKSNTIHFNKIYKLTFYLSLFICIDICSNKLFVYRIQFFSLTLNWFSYNVVIHKWNCQGEKTHFFVAVKIERDDWLDKILHIISLISIILNKKRRRTKRTPIIIIILWPHIFLAYSCLPSIVKKIYCYHRPRYRLVN